MKEFIFERTISTLYIIILENMVQIVFLKKFKVFFLFKINFFMFLDCFDVLMSKIIFKK